MLIEVLILELFSQEKTLNLQVKGFYLNYHRHHPILTLHQSHQNKKKLSQQQACQTFENQSRTFALSH